LNIIILGGGIAGIAAAWSASKSGMQVTLIEQRPYLGGRLCSYQNATDPGTFDNGPHLFLSSYTETRRLLREMGLLDYFKFPWPGAIAFAGPEGRKDQLREWLLPAPLNFAAGLFGFRLLSWNARRRAFAAAKNLLAEPVDPSSSIESWLQEYTEAEERHIFWHPLVSAALNCSPAEAPLQHLQAVFKEGFCKGITGGRLGFTRLPLGHICNDKMRRILTEAGMRVQPHATITGVMVEEGKVHSVTLNGETPLHCDGLIAALPPRALRKWLADCGLEKIINQDISIAEWDYNPISTVYLWAENRPLLDAYTCTPDCSFDWVFDFGSIWKDRNGPIGLLLGRKAFTFSDAELASIQKELNDRFPQFNAVTWKARRWIRERRATPRKPKSLWGRIISQSTGIRNLFLAGDWLDPDLPPTVEAAVRSGRRAVQSIC
jgi:zeta-carotene desaturase